MQEVNCGFRQTVRQRSCVRPHMRASSSSSLMAQSSRLERRGAVPVSSKAELWFRSIVPASYPIPGDGPVGDMLKAQGRHPFRPAHVHFMFGHPGCETLATHVFLADDPYLDSDVVFGVKDSLIRALEYQEPGITARGNRIDQPMAALHYSFVFADEIAHTQATA